MNADDDRAAFRRAVTVLDRQPHVADVEVERIAVEQEEERRHEDEDEQRAPVARRFAAAPSGRPRAPCSCARPRAPLCRRPRRGTRLRATARPVDASTGDAGGAKPLAQASLGATPPRRAAPRARRCRTGWSSPHRAWRRAAAWRRPGGCADFEDRPAGEDPFDLGRRADRGEPAGMNQRDAMAPLRFVQVVRRDEDGHTGRRPACR